MKPPFEWDSLSDQPHVIRDKKFKNSLKKMGVLHYIKSFFVALVTLPVVMLLMLFCKQKPSTRKGNEFIGLCVNLDREPALTPRLVAQLGVKKIVVRIPLWDCDNLDAYKAFCSSFDNVDIMFCVLQDREHVTDHALLKKNIYRVFNELEPLSNTFQIGNAVNRLKWGCISVEESLRFFECVQQQRDAHFPHIKLVGSGVIDFEPISTVRSVFHGFRAKADAMAALLYVDRRGAPESTQGWIFDFKNKIRFVYTAMRLSPKTTNSLYITEINWPLKDRLGYAPAQGDCTVSEEDAAVYLTRAYLIAWATGQVETMYWHQLIAPGYGLVDHRNGIIRNMPAFYALKTLMHLLHDMQVEGLHCKNGHYHLICSNQLNKKIDITWLSDRSMSFCEQWGEFDEIYTHLGEKLDKCATLDVNFMPLFKVAYG